MKVAIESNDGKTIKFPFEPTAGYIVFDLEDKNISHSTYTKIADVTSAVGTNPLDECAAVITRGMSKNERERLRDRGVDIFVTFKKSAESALSSYMKERIINRQVMNESHI